MSVITALTHTLRRFPLSAVGLLLAASLLGGGRGSLGDVLVQMLALGMLVAFVWSRAYRDAPALPAWVWCLPVLAVAPPMVQLLPVPASWWSTGAARGELWLQLQAIGVKPSGRWSLDPTATERALWSLLPAVALYLGTLSMRTRQQLVMLVLILLVAVGNVLLGFAQLADGPESVLRFYLPTNPSEAVGFFANRNHLASLLVMCLPMALAATGWAVAERIAGRRLHPLWAVAGSGLVVLIILGIAMARSRAGLLLGMLAILLALPMILGLRRQRGAKRILAVAIGVGVVVSVQFALLGILQRLDSDPLEDGRWTYARTTLVAAKAYEPLGSGIGSFRNAYPPFESQPDSVVVNHAHNDYLELWMEGGWLMAPVFLLAALAWLALAWRVWQAGADDGDARTSRLIARACWAGITLALLHEALDYPLRTTAASGVFAVLSAIALSQSARRSLTALLANQAQPLQSATVSHIQPRRHL